VFRRTLLIGLLSIAALGTVAGPAAAKSTDVIRTGNCTAASDWKLKLSHEDGRIETEFEVDQNRIGKTWKVKLIQNGVVVWKGWRTTQAPSGSFEVRKLLPNRAGTDTIVARAKNPATGEICRGTASI
jgi:hypothetical protein